MFQEQHTFNSLIEISLTPLNSNIMTRCLVIRTPSGPRPSKTYPKKRKDSKRMQDIVQESLLYSLHGKDYLWEIEKDAFWKYVSEHVTIPAQCPAFSLNLSFSLGVFLKDVSLMVFE